ncbi:hypothetical protein M885DRAFT_524407 [Pelagophyceae sp. CCMP2097]|nr:hypothetical protein M885DRAFT_524407 [Pelagophyceae sp. CCMP2097]
MRVGRSAVVPNRVVGLAAAFAAAIPGSAVAVSGGGKDFAVATLKGLDMSGQNYNGKDFSGADAVGTNFRGSKMRGARFFKSTLAGADFSNCDLSGASFEGANLEGAIFTGAVAEGTAFSPTLDDVGDVEGVDFTDAVMRSDVQKHLCARPDAKGTNKVTGVDTRDSLLCN